MSPATTTEQQLRGEAVRLMQIKRTLAEAVTLLELRMEIMQKQHQKLRTALEDVIRTARAALRE